MENKKIEELNIKLTVDTSELEDALQKFAKAGQVFNTVAEASPLPATELKEGFAEVRAVPQMPEEKQKLVKMLTDHLEFMLDRTRAVGLDSLDAKIICELSKVLADLVG